MILDSYDVKRNPLGYLRSAQKVKRSVDSLAKTDPDWIEYALRLAANIAELEAIVEKGEKK